MLMESVEVSEWDMGPIARVIMIVQRLGDCRGDDLALYKMNHHYYYYHYYYYYYLSVQNSLVYGNG